jgi:hypothetical protein
MCNIDIIGKSKMAAGKLGNTKILVTLPPIEISTRFKRLDPCFLRWETQWCTRAAHGFESGAKKFEAS